jgi:hypothetical protein
MPAPWNIAWAVPKAALSAPVSAPLSIIMPGLAEEDYQPALRRPELT